jgi:hypothetical protein
LKSDYTHFLSVDDDINFQVNDILKLLQADKPIIGATYRIKQPGPSVYCHNELPGASTESIREVQSVGTGLLLIKRHVFEELKSAYPSNKYFSDTAFNKGEELHSYFNIEVRNGRLVSEDFCLEDDYRKIGGSVWLDASISVGHIGFCEYKDVVNATLNIDWSKMAKGNTK